MILLRITGIIWLVAFIGLFFAITIVSILINNSYDLEEINNLQDPYISLNIALISIISFFSITYILLWFLLKIKFKKIENENIKNELYKKVSNKLIYIFIGFFTLFCCLLIVFISLLVKSKPFYVYYATDGKNEIFWYKGWGSIDGINWVDLSNSGLNVSADDFDYIVCFSNDFNALDSSKILYWILPYLSYAPLISIASMIILIQVKYLYNKVKIIKNAKKLVFKKSNQGEKDLIEFFGNKMYKKEFDINYKKNLWIIAFIFFTILYLNVFIC